ncbi:MAB_1171c family putative transporter [Amycolatopsis sp. NPDC051903]|uniref:MAB_1171c family putative transporter n=1 Tax=Amycolatopsis sp. NPDC051903 TaxID=3363936 RepID=UPI00378D902F
MNALKIVLFASSAVSSYAALLYKLSSIRRGWRDVGYLTMMATLVLQCLTFTMGAVSLSVVTFFGVRNLAILVLHLSAVAYCISAQILLLQWANPLAEVRRAIRGWLIAGVVLCVVLTVLFFIGNRPGTPASAFGTGSDNPVILTYLLLFIVSQAVPCVTIYRLCVPSARSTSKPWLRRALRLLAVGAVVLFLYCTARTVNILSPVLGFTMGPWAIVASLFSALGIVIVSLGLTMPSWGVHVSSLRTWGRNYSSYRALYPLWHSLYESSPDIALEPPTSNGAERQWSDLHYRLHRRVIEIRDGWRALRPYMDRADGSATGTDRAVVEATKIKQALRAKDSGVAPALSQDNGSFDDHDAKTFAAEVDWLTQVSAAYGRLN